MKTLLPRESQTRKEKNSHLMLFCALLLARKSRATLEEAIGVAPLDGNAKCLAESLLT